MGFDLYAAGSFNPASTQLKRELGYDQLLSQLNEKKSVYEWVTYKREHPECKSKLFIDSGAYTAHTKGKEVDVDAYIKFMNEIDDQVYIFAQVDKIPGVWGQPKTPEQLAEAPILSWENYKYMVTRVKSPKKLLPIFHQGEDFKYLKQMLEYTYPEDVMDKSCVGQPIDYIGISCNKEVSSNEWIDWFGKAFKIIKDSPNPNVKTHAFGMTSLRILEQFPFTSADSTSWVRTASFGNIMVGSSVVYTSNRNMMDPNHIYNQSKAVRDAVAEICKKYHFDIDEIVNDDKPYPRALFNLCSLKDWAENYQYKGHDDYEESLWD